jgi:hypothetical protein
VANLETSLAVENEHMRRLLHAAANIRMTTLMMVAVGSYVGRLLNVRILERIRYLENALLGER